MSEIKSLKEIVETLLECNYECEAGPLKNNKDFRLLAKMAGVELPKSVGEGVVDLKKAFESMAHSIANSLSYTSDQRRRDEIVEQAKQDIKKIVRVGRSYLTPGDTGNYTYRHRVFYVEFVVNRKKRTVVALVRDARTGEVRERGKAKCAPDDCFNVHIGKAIALRRALGLDVPDEYLNAPQPTEVRVGDIVKSKRTGRVCKVNRFCEDEILDSTWGRPFYIDGVGGWLGTEQVNIIDDSRDDEEV
jgi:hypothetical protein